ncbi:MAG TPA: hypothetical protein VFS77_14460 [Pyrinomonadaceae bacterium]|nr:hypothetical protein [Pyrinomonadaceae bacterium]
MTPEIPFRRNVVQPVECIKAGWALIKDEYWMFVGICAVGMLLASAVPLGILLGPMMCGIYMTLFKKRRGEFIEFGTLFKGFDFFGPSFVATLIHILPIIAIVLPSYFLFYVGMILSVATQDPNNPNPAAVFGVFFGFVIFILVIMILITVLSIGFTFSYPLITDRKLQGFDAVKLSFRAAMANFWRLLGMALLTSLLQFGGLLLCYIGIIFVFPINFAAIAAAYEQVFGLANPNENWSNLPPPPPTF